MCMGAPGDPVALMMDQRMRDTASTAWKQHSCTLQLRGDRAPDMSLDQVCFNPVLICGVLRDKSWGIKRCHRSICWVRAVADTIAGLCIEVSLQQNNCPLSYYIVTCDLEMIHPFYLSLDFAIISCFSQILLGMLMCLHRDIFCKINLRTFKMNEHT